jgi:ketosteroid isomerase-like protein
LQSRHLGRFLNDEINTGENDMKSSDTVKQELATANKGFIAKFNAGDAAGVAACYTADAKFLAPHAPAIEGREAIQAFLQGAMDMGVAAIEYGRYIMKTADGTVADEGNFLVHWKKQDGAWRLHRDSITTDVAAG